MLNALLKGNAGTAQVEIAAGTSLREVFRRTEDLLTSTVFERLSYLSGATAWEVMRRTFAPDLGAFRVAELEEVEFWPRYGDETGHADSVLPDAVLFFTVGDPARQVVVNVECKTAGGQYARQWERQILAAAKETEADRLVFAALGGLGRNHARDALELRAQLSSEAQEAAEIVSAGWGELARAVAEVEPRHGGEERALGDIAEALALYGYRHVDLNAGLAAMSRPVVLEPTLATLPLGEAA